MAYKQKEHDYKRIENDIKEGNLSGQKVILLSGHEDYLVKSYEKRIRDIYVNPAAAELDYVMLEGEDTSVDQIISHSDTLPMISEKRVVTIRNYPGLLPASKSFESKSSESKSEDSSANNDSDVKSLISYIDNIPQTTLLIFICERLSAGKALSKKISKEGKSYNFDRLDRKDLSSFIKKRFKSEGKLADDQVVREIMNATGYFERDSDYNLNGIAGDVTKIASFAAEVNVTPSDVSNVLSTSLETDAFALLDTLSRGETGDAMLLINNIMETGESSFKLLGLIISQFELMLGIKEYSLRGKSKNEIMNEMGIKSEFRYRKVEGYISDYSVDQLENILKKLYEVEMNIKTGIYSDKLAMTMFVAGI